MRCSVDLRQWVADFVRTDGSKAEGARRFKEGGASVDRWLKPGGDAYKRPAPPGFEHKRNGRGISRCVGIAPETHSTN
jgi:hypothetical protein